MAELEVGHEFTQVLPSTDSVVDAKLHELSFVEPVSLVAILTDSGNELEAIFKQGDCWYLVSWFTSA